LKYRLKIGEDTVDVDFSSSDSKESGRFAIGDHGCDVHYQVISGNHLHLVVNGKATEAFVTRGDQGKDVFVRGRAFFIQDADKVSLRRARRTAPEDTPGEVTPPMPSVVVRILVKEGEQVKKGQGLVVVSAMKMETTLVSPSDGIVKKINTTVDSKVAPGDILVEIEEEVEENE